MVYSFSLAAAMDRHKLYGLNQNKLTYSHGGQKSKTSLMELTSGDEQGCFLLGASQKKGSASLALQLLMAFPPLATHLDLCFQQQLHGLLL